LRFALDHPLPFKGEDGEPAKANEAGEEFSFRRKSK
jgi:hypothetical protein